MIEVMVVGGGIAGCAAAVALRDRGAAVTVVEPTAPGSGATGASAGMLAVQYETPEPGPLFRLSVASRERWEGFRARLVDASGEPFPIFGSGMLVANRTPEEDAGARESAGWQRDEGLRAEVLAPDDARGIEPGLAAGPVSWLWLPDEAHVDAQRLPDLLASLLAAEGVRLISGNRVAEVRSGGGAVTGVEMADGRSLDADRVVLAAGARSGEIRGLPGALPVRPVRGQMLRYRPAAAGASRAGGAGGAGPIVADHEGHYVVPRGDAGVVAGSTMEEAGFRREITEAGVAAVREAAGRLLPLLRGFEPVERWAGLRPLAPDGRPIVGPDPDLAGLVHATGYGRNGILLAPAAGEIAADAVVGREPELPWRPFSPGRFDRGGPEGDGGPEGEPGEGS